MAGAKDSLRAADDTGPSDPDRSTAADERPSQDGGSIRLERHRRAIRTAEQSWPEFLRDLLVRTLIIAVGVAILVVLVLALTR